MKKILYIEDDKAISDIFMKRFKDAGYSVVVCDNGEDGLNATLDFKPDLIITGILMPKVSGFDVIDVLKQTKETKHIPIMVLSALSRQEDKDRALKLGAIDYMVMSEVKIADVLQKVDNFFKANTTIPLGKDNENIQHTLDFKQVHSVLIAGQTGSGKSHFFDNIVVNILKNNSPDAVQLILIDPKYVQFHQFKDIPHLVIPVINDPDEAVKAMDWIAVEIDRRLSSKEKSPDIFVLCDEISDLMMMDSNFYEKIFVKIAEHGGKVGIYSVIATSRPSADVFTDNLLKAYKTTIAFALASKVDSQRILHSDDGVDLAGKGDMLLKINGNSELKRLQAPFIPDDVIEKMIDSLV